MILDHSDDELLLRDIELAVERARAAFVDEDWSGASRNSRFVKRQAERLIYHLRPQLAVVPK